MALAHVVGDKVEAAYRRGDLFEKRRDLAEAWARFCGGDQGDVCAAASGRGKWPVNAATQACGLR